MQSAPAIPTRFSVRSENGSLQCENVDLAQVRLLSRSLLLALASACVEKTYGDPFKSSLSAAATVKADMVSFLTAQHPPIPEMAPLDMAEDLLDQFVQTNTSFFSRVSSKLMNNETKEDRIEDLAEEMELAETWVSSDRDKVAMVLLRNLDVRGICVCRLRFDLEHELMDHKSMCPFRPITCGNEHCGHIFSALHVLEHDTKCPFKLLSCEQRCEAVLTRSEMDKHCVTVCPMRPVKCPFFHVGCVDMVPHMTLEQHCQEFVASHLLCALQVMQKQEMLVSSLTQRVLLLEKALAINERSEAVDIGTLSLAGQHQDAKIRALEQETERLRQDLKKSNALTEVVELRREIETLRTKLPS
ncbi:hypothetical protein GOP47_0026450 [Adiantum capillus-veneris]|nr:hypothetical protein GOP47_0026450 [Adiantum capillus-veneris]